MKNASLLHTTGRLTIAVLFSWMAHSGVQAQTTLVNGSLNVGAKNTVTGANAVAMGRGNIASGTASVALGLRNQATSYCSIALGANNQATNANTTAIGDGCIAAGSDSLAIGAYSWAQGASDAAVGSGFTDPNSEFGFAGGWGHIEEPTGRTMPVFGATAFSLGVSGGSYSFSANYGAANNFTSVALGYDTVTASPGQCVVGICNRIVGVNEDFSLNNWNTWDSSVWNPTNAVFIVGNGTENTPSNAMQVRRDGLVLINPGGDLSMGSFTNGPTP